MKYIKLSQFCLLFVLISCLNEFQGSQSLGNNFALLKGDADNQEIIIFCSPKRTTSSCSGGPQIIPSIQNYYKGDYVSDTEFDDNWIIIKVLNKERISQEAQYWMIDKNFELDERFEDWPLEESVSDEFKKFIQSKVVGPLNKTSFDKVLIEKKINLKFDK